MHILNVFAVPFYKRDCQKRLRCSILIKAIKLKENLENVKKYIFQVKYQPLNNNDAGPKAKKDVEHYLMEEQFEKVDLNLGITTEDQSILSKFKKMKFANLDIAKIIKQYPEGEIVLQYPTYSPYIMKKLITKIKELTDAKLYLLIHDLESVRFFQHDEKFLANERYMLNVADGIISHNPSMTKWMKTHQIATPIVDLEIFDYDNPCSINTEIKDGDYTLAFAGNLRAGKADFLQKMNLKHQLKLFGPNPAENYPSSIDYQGQHTPEELPQYLDQSFGLIWDGDAVDECNGMFGEYLKYNNPHKTSLYLSSGLPVIIWKKAALAQFVEKYNVGITVDSLNDIDTALDQLSTQQYQEMKANTVKLAQKLREGYFVKNAVKQLEEITK